MLQKTVCEYLEAEGFEVVTASNGEEGVSFAVQKRPDLILLDIILPKKDGYEVLKELKEKPETKEIPVIVLTNLGSLNDIQRCIELGAAAYLVKSDYRLEEIVSKIKEMLKSV